MVMEVTFDSCPASFTAATATAIDCGGHNLAHHTTRRYWAATSMAGVYTNLMRGACLQTGEEHVIVGHRTGHKHTDPADYGREERE